MSSTTPSTAGAPAPSPSPGTAAAAPAAATAKTASSPSPAPAPSTSGDKISDGKTGDAKTTTKKKSTKKKKAAGDGTKKPVKRRKVTAKSSGSAASNAAMLAAAKTATADLAQSRALSAARRTDPLWYRIEDVLPPTTTTTTKTDHHHPQGHHHMADPASTVLPEQVQIVEAALAHNNMTRSDVTPQAMACLLEQARRYAQELLEDAQDYAAHAGGMFAPTPTKPGTAGSECAVTPSGMPVISARDYLLAAEMRPDHPQAVTAQLPRLNLLAQQVNGTPLPPIPPQCYSGVLLPQAGHVLTARTFDVVTGAHVAQKMIQAAPPQTKAFAGSMMMANSEMKAASSSKPSKNSSKDKPSYGASRGAQIPIKLKKDETAEPKPAATTASPGTTTTVAKKES